MAPENPDPPIRAALPGPARKPKAKRRKAAKRVRRSAAPVGAEIIELSPGTPGRPNWRPSEKEKAQVGTMAGLGMRQCDMALIIGVDEKTLRKYLDEPMKKGKALANFKVAQTLYQMATSGQNLGATIYWTKAQMGWREVQQVQQLDKDGNPVDPVPSGSTFIIRVER